MQIQDLADATATVNRAVRRRMEAGISYLRAVGDEREIIARCIADRLITGRPVYPEWLAEYLACEQMSGRAVLSYTQARLERERAALDASHNPAGCGCGYHLERQA